VWLVVVGADVGVVTDPTGTVVLALLSLLSPITMIRPTARPITTATRMPIVQRARVSTGAMLAEGSAENLERLVDLALADDERGQEPERVIADRVDHESLGQRVRGRLPGMDALDSRADHQAPSAGLGDPVECLEARAQPAPQVANAAEQLGVVDHLECGERGGGDQRPPGEGGAMVAALQHVRRLPRRHAGAHGQAA